MDKKPNYGPQNGDSTPPEPESGYEEAAKDARQLIRVGMKAALATFDVGPNNGSPTPYASLVTTATSHDGTPILLISKLARHTKNLISNPRASLLFDGTGPTGDLLASGRVTLIGQLTPTTSEGLARRFISRHPDAQGYASFADFSFYEMSVESAHYIGGFGRIVDIKGEDLATSLEGADELISAEPDIIAHMNEDHAEAISLYTTRLLDASKDDGPWRLSGIDPDGADIIGRTCGLRLRFENSIGTPDEARGAFKDLAAIARAKSAETS